MVVPGLRQRGVDFFGGAGFLDSGAHKFLAHGNDHQFWIHCRLRQG